MKKPAPAAGRARVRCWRCPPVALSDAWVGGKSPKLVGVSARLINAVSAPGSVLMSSTVTMSMVESTNPRAASLTPTLALTPMGHASSLSDAQMPNARALILYAPVQLAPNACSDAAIVSSSSMSTVASNSPPISPADILDVTRIGELSGRNRSVSAVMEGGKPSMPRGDASMERVPGAPESMPEMSRSALRSIPHWSTSATVVIWMTVPSPSERLSRRPYGVNHDTLVGVSD